MSEKDPPMMTPGNSAPPPASPSPEGKGIPKEGTPAEGKGISKEGTPAEGKGIPKEGTTPEPKGAEKESPSFSRRGKQGEVSSPKGAKKAAAAAGAAIPAGKAGAAAVKGTMALKIVSIAVAVAILFFLMIYGAGVLAETGGFSISFDKAASGAAQISLSETEDFASPTVRLEVPPIEYMTNIDGRSIPAEIDSMADGAHGTSNYIAYSFYLRSEGADCELKETFRIESSLRHAEEAIRVAVWRNGEQTVYAKVGADGLPELNTTPFYGDVVFEETKPLAAGEVVRYTVVIWLEGNDPECRDEIKGGNVKLSLTFVAGEAAA